MSNVNSVRVRKHECNNHSWNVFKSYLRLDWMGQLTNNFFLDVFVFYVYLHLYLCLYFHMCLCLYLCFYLYLYLMKRRLEWMVEVTANWFIQLPRHRPN